MRFFGLAAGSQGQAARPAALVPLLGVALVGAGLLVPARSADAATVVVPAGARAVPVGVSTEFTDGPWDGCWLEESAEIGRPLLLQRRTGSAWVTVARGSIAETPHCVDGGGVVRWKPTPVGRTRLRVTYPAYRGEPAMIRDPFTVWVAAAPSVPRGPGAAALGSVGAALPGGGLWPVSLPGLTRTVAVVSAGASFYAVMADGTVRAWGDNAYGQLGDGTTTSRSTPVAVVGLDGVRSLVTAGSSAYAVLADGTVRAWGSNSGGRLGDGTNTSRSTPVAVVGLDGVSSVAATGYSVFAVRTDGTVWTWGSGTMTAAAVPELAGVAAVEAVGDEYMDTAYAILTDGTVRTWKGDIWGHSGYGSLRPRSAPAPVPGLTGVARIRIDTGRFGDPVDPATVYAVHRDGTVSAWGDNAQGQVGDGTTQDRTSPVPVTGLAGVVELTAHASSAWAVLDDGTVKAWGYDEWGQLGVGSRGNKTAPVVVPGLTGVVNLAAGGWLSDEDPFPAVAEGHFAAYALRADGTVWAWGDNTTGQLGDGTTTSRARPAKVARLAGVAAVTTGPRGALAVFR